MVGALFGANADTLDIAKIRGRLRKNPPYEVLSGLGGQYIQQISSRVRFDTDSKIRDMASQAYDFQDALEDLEEEYRSDIVSVFTDELSSISLSEIEDIVDTLNTYDSADSEMIESVSKFVALDQKTIDDTGDAAEMASRLIRRSDDEQIQAILISMKLAATSVYQRYNDITIVGAGSGGDFAEHFVSVGEYYVD